MVINDTKIDQNCQKKTVVAILLLMLELYLLRAFLISKIYPQSILFNVIYL